MSLNFELPLNLSIESFLSQLNAVFPVQVAAQQYCLKTYYDSFDWRLYRNGLIAEFDRSKDWSVLNLTDLCGELQASVDLTEVPRFWQEFQHEQLRELLEPVLEMRALLAVGSVDYDSYQINLLNKNQKTVVRLALQKHSLFSNRALLLPVKGYDKPLAQVVALFQEIGLTQPAQPLLKSVLKLQGRHPEEYSAKLNIRLAPDVRADAAAKIIYRNLLDTMRVNEQGTLADIDSEFLHDFRVAIRRTRAGLSQIKRVFPPKITARYQEFFSWLGDITTPTRDLDVYLLNVPEYKNSLPEALKADLDPLHDFLRVRQQHAQKQLAKKLRSKHYLSTLKSWEEFLNTAAPKNPDEENARLPIKTLADRRLLKVYKRVLKEGNAITDSSSGDTLHTLRKTCKKLRYLLEFFQNLYPDKHLKPLLKSLKGLQNVLGDFQDYEVQEQQLKLFSLEMMAEGTVGNTVLAMDTLIEILDERRTRARNEFADSFAAFKKESWEALFTG